MKLLGCLLFLFLTVQAYYPGCEEFPLDMEKNTCTPEYVLPVKRKPPHGNPCLVIDGDLILENIDNSAKIEHIWNIKKVTGRILINNTRLETIDFEKLRQVGYNGVVPGVIVVGNEKLKKLKFGTNDCRVEFYRSNYAGNETRYMVVVNNGNYRMPKLEHKELKNWYRSTDHSRFLIDVEQTEKMEEPEMEILEVTVIAMCVAVVPMAIITAACYCWIENIKI